MLLNDSMSNLDKAMKIAGFAGMVISITVALVSNLFSKRSAI